MKAKKTHDMRVSVCVSVMCLFTPTNRLIVSLAGGSDQWL